MLNQRRRRGSLALYLEFLGINHFPRLPDFDAILTGRESGGWLLQAELALTLIRLRLTCGDEMIFFHAGYLFGDPADAEGILGQLRFLLPAEMQARNRRRKWRLNFAGS